MSTEGVKPDPAAAGDLGIEMDFRERAAETRPVLDLEGWMERYQQADAEAPGVLIRALSPALLRFFRSQPAVREHADDLLQETWLRIHRVRHTYRPGESLLPWIYAIARRVRVDGYRRMRRVSTRESTVGLAPEALSLEASAPAAPEVPGPSFEALVAALPEGQREVVTMLKVGGLSLEEVARATSSTVGAVKQKAHRAYERMRKLASDRTAE